MFILQRESKRYIFKVRGIVHQYNDKCGLKAVKDIDKGGETAQLAQTTATTVPE